MSCHLAVFDVVSVTWFLASVGEGSEEISGGADHDTGSTAGSPQSERGTDHLRRQPSESIFHCTDFRRRPNLALVFCVNFML